jgi:hypothetical protein
VVGRLGSCGMAVVVGLVGLVGGVAGGGGRPTGGLARAFSAYKRPIQIIYLIKC